MCLTIQQMREESKIEGAVETYKDLGISLVETIKRIAERFQLTENASSELWDVCLNENASAARPLICSSASLIPMKLRFMAVYICHSRYMGMAEAVANAHTVDSAKKTTSWLAYARMRMVDMGQTVVPAESIQPVANAS